MKPVVLITGGADGLGRETAASLTDKYTVILLDINAATLTRVAKKLDCDFFVCDVSSPESVEIVVKEVINQYHRIDCLINNAGIYLQGQLTANDPKLIQRVIEVNTLGPINLCRYVVPHMKKQASGVIINIISQAAHYPRASRTVYHASKWALDGFTQSLQPELNGYGIKVIGVYPGLMKTKLLSRQGFQRDMTTALDPADVVKIIHFLISLPPHLTVPQIDIRHLRHG